MNQRPIESLSQVISKNLSLQNRALLLTIVNDCCVRAHDRVFEATVSEYRGADSEREYEELEGELFVLSKLLECLADRVAVNS